MYSKNSEQLSSWILVSAATHRYLGIKTTHLPHTVHQYCLKRE